MDSLDIETIEQIKGIVNDAKNKNAPLEKTKKVKKVKELKPEPEQEPIQLPEPLPEQEPIQLPSTPPVKPKRVQSEKQKAAFTLLQEKRKEQVEKQKLVKKIEASKLLLENDVKLKASKSKSKKPKSTTVNFNNFQKHVSDNESDDSDDSDSEEEPKPVKQWGKSTRNKKSVKPVQVVKTEPKYIQPTFF